MFICVEFELDGRNMETNKIGLMTQCECVGVCWLSVGYVKLYVNVICIRNSVNV